MNFQVGMRKMMEFIPTTVGAKGNVVLNKLQLKLLAKADKTGTISKILETVSNPQLEVAYKAQSNYSIAAMHLRDIGADGSKTVARGAISVVNPGEEAVVKARLSVGENGEVLSGNGFIDIGKDSGNLENVYTSTRRKNGVLTVESRVEDTLGEHIEINEEKAEEFLANIPRGEKLVGKYKGMLLRLGTGIDKFMADVRSKFGYKRYPHISTPVRPQKVAEKVSCPNIRETAVAVEEPLAKIKEEPAIKEYGKISTSPEPTTELKYSAEKNPNNSNKRS